MKYVQIEGSPHLVRDLETNAILNITNNPDMLYQKLREEKLRVKQQAEEINNIKDQVSEMKAMLEKLLNQKG